MTKSTGSKAPMKYPYATLHEYKTKGFADARDLVQKLNPSASPKEAIKYLQDVVKTNGRPDLIDLYEDGRL